MLRQGIPPLQVDAQVQHGAALPPAREVVVLGHLVEAELLVVIGADELGRIDGAALERRIDVAGRDLLRHGAEPREHLPAHAADAEFQAFQVVDGLDILAEPAAHLRAGVAGRNAVGVEFPERGVDEFLAAGKIPPRLLVAGVEAERQAGAEAERRVLAEVEIGGRMRALDRTAGHRVQGLQAGHQLAGGERLDLELVVARLGDVPAQGLGGAEDRVERLGEAGGEAPFQLRRGLGDGRHRDGRGCQRRRGSALQERSALQDCVLPGRPIPPNLTHVAFA